MVNDYDKNTDDVKGNNSCRRNETENQIIENFCFGLRKALRSKHEISFASQDLGDTQTRSQSYKRNVVLICLKFYDSAIALFRSQLAVKSLS